MDETKKHKVAAPDEEMDGIRGMIECLLKCGLHKLSPEEREKQAKQNPVETFK